MTAPTTFSARNHVAPGALGRLSRNPAAPWRHIDMVLVGCVTAVCVLGCLMVFSSTRGTDPSDFDTGFVAKQILFIGIGAVLMLVVALVDYRRYREIAPIAYGIVLLALLMVVSGLGSERKGTQAWFQIGPFQLQPSELAKIVVIVTLASVIAQLNSELDARRLAIVLGIAGVPMALIMLQPDLGTTLVFVAVCMGMLLIGGAQGRHIAALTLVGIVGVGFVLNSGMLEEYQKCRFTSFLETESKECVERDASYNQDQAEVAIGSGGLLGAGLGQGTQTRLGIVPEQHTDFIFTAVGEELGFIGSGTLLLLLGIIAWRIWRTAQLARDPLGTLICVGILSMFVFQVFENIGMTMGIMPVTGIPLPFMSYGGSSTLTAFIAMALVLAERKAAAVAQDLDGPALVLGGDTVLDVDGETRGKPVSLDEARGWWASVAGRSGTLHSGLCVIDTDTGRQASGVATTIVHYGVPSAREMDAYLATGEALAVAGAFTIDGYAAPFVDRIEGDHGAVLGLSLPLLRRLLAEIDLEITDLWRAP